MEGLSYQRDRQNKDVASILLQRVDMKTHTIVRKPRLISERAPVHPVRVAKVRLPIHVVRPIVIGSREAQVLTPLSK